MKHFEGNQMIRNIQSQNAGALYNNSGGSKAKEAASKSDAQHLSRVEELKQSIAKGEYKIDLEATARKMAEALS